MCAPKAILLRLSRASRTSRSRVVPSATSRVRRTISGGMGVIFKGSGFYTTDYKKSSALTGGGNGGSSKEPGREKDKSAEGVSEKASEKPKEPAGGKTSEK